jgi:adenosylhomocysteine nucleosidase
MKVGIMGAMPEEVLDIKHMMADITEHKHATRLFYSGSINNIDVVLTVSRWGKVASATTAAALIEKFHVTHLIFTGVAGGTHNDINVGDIVISEALYQHDMDATPIFKKHEIPFTGKVYFYAEKTLMQKTLTACKTFLQSREKDIPHHIFKTFNIDNPKVVLGTIGSGDEFITSIEKIKSILADKPETTAIEMEGAAVAQVCDDFKIPFVVIRTISDKADSNAHVDFTKFVKDVASHYSARIVKNICVLSHKA